jgi:hypothetical protein
LAAKRDSTGFTEKVVPVVADVIMGTETIIYGFSKTSYK